MRPMTSPYLPLVAPSAGDHVMVPSSSPRETSAPEEPTCEVWEVPVHEMPGANVTSLGAISVEVDGVSPRLGDDTRGFLRDLVMRGASLGRPGSTVLGDVILATRFSSVVGPG
jgi:hypothetical protein